MPKISQEESLQQQQQQQDSSAGPKMQGDKKKPSAAVQEQNQVPQDDIDWLSPGGGGAGTGDNAHGGFDLGATADLPNFFPTTDTGASGNNSGGADFFFPSSSSSSSNTGGAGPAENGQIPPLNSVNDDFLLGFSAADTSAGVTNNNHTNISSTGSSTIDPFLLPVESVPQQQNQDGSSVSAADSNNDHSSSTATTKQDGEFAHPDSVLMLDRKSFPMHDTSQIQLPVPHTTPVDDLQNQSEHASSLTHFLAEPQQQKITMQQQQSSKNSDEQHGNSPQHQNVPPPPAPHDQKTPAMQQHHQGAPPPSSGTNQQQQNSSSGGGAAAGGGGGGSTAEKASSYPRVTPSRALQDQFAASSSGDRAPRTSHPHSATTTATTTTSTTAAASSSAAGPIHQQRPSLVDMSALEKALAEAKHTVDQVQKKNKGSHTSGVFYTDLSQDDDAETSSAAAEEEERCSNIDAAQVWSALEDAHVKALSSRKKLNDSNADLAMEMLRLAEALGPHGEINRVAGLDASTPLLEALPRAVEVLERLFEEKEPVFFESDFSVDDPF